MELYKYKLKVDIKWLYYIRHEILKHVTRTEKIFYLLQENSCLRFRESQVLKIHELLIAMNQSRTLLGPGHMLLSLLLKFFSSFWILNYSVLHRSSQMPLLVSFPSESFCNWSHPFSGFFIFKFICFSQFHEYVYFAQNTTLFEK